MITRLHTFLIILTITTGSTFAQPCTISVNGNRNISFCQNQPASLAVTTTGITNVEWTSFPAGAIDSGDTLLTPTLNTSIATTYNVFVSGNNGLCMDSVSVTINPLPSVPIFSVTPNTTPCSGDTITFTVTNPQINVTYTWNFGDGENATGVSVVHVYNSTGNGTVPFNVTVSASVLGTPCSVVSPATAIQLSQQPDAMLVDLVNSPQFVTCNGTTTPLTVAEAGSNIYANYVIDWGDGITYSSSSPPFIPGVSHTYGSLGFNTITYTVTNAAGCSAVRTYTVFNGGNPQVGLANPGSTTGLCTPASLAFPITNVSNNPPGTIYIVTTNDGSLPDTLQHPPPASYLHEFTNSSCGSSSTSYQNSFYIRIEAVNPCASSSATVEPITTNSLPNADFTISPDTIACVNTPVTFTNTSLGGAWINSLNECDTTQILNWIITPNTYNVLSGNLGNNPPFVNIPSSWGSDDVSVEFTATGTYTIKLVVRSRNTCGYDSIIRTMCVQATPTPSFTATSSESCTPLTVNLTDNSIINNSCGTSTRLWNITQLSGVCSQDSANSFMFISGTNNTSANPVVRFYNAGTYSAEITLISPCGSYTSAPQIFTVRKSPEGALSGIPPFLCVSESITPSATVSDCLDSISQYVWTFPTGTPASSNNATPGTVTFASTGIKNISLAVSNQCGTTTATATVEVQAAPVANAGNNTDFCSGDTAQIGSAPVNNLTYSWNPATGLSSSAIANPTVMLAATDTIVTQTYIITVANQAGCTSIDTVVVRAYPPAVAEAGNSVGICNIGTIALAGVIGGSASSAVWTSGNGGTFSNPSSLVSTYSPTIPTGSVTLTLTTNNPTGPCPAVSDSVIISVVPPPVADAGTDSSICSGTDLPLGSIGQTGYTYSWTPATGLNDSSVSNPTVTIVNVSTSAISETYTLVVSAFGCSDTDQIALTVRPEGVVDTIPAQTICSNTQTTLVTPTSAVTGTTFSWSTTSTAGVTGFTASGTGDIPAQTLINSGTTDGTVTYFVTPTLNGCPGTPTEFIVTVHPLPTVNPIPSQVLCSGSQTTEVILTSAVAGTTFAWSATGSANTSGFTTNGTGDIPPQTLIYTGTTQGLVTYTVTPTVNGCIGTPYVFVDTIFPLPDISITPALDSICSGTQTNILLSSNTAGATFAWTVTAPSSVSGANAGSGNNITQTLINSGYTPETVVYNIATNVGSCGGQGISATVVVSPSPSIQFSIPNQTICSGGTAEAVQVSSLAPNAVFSWTANVPSGVTGMTASGTDVIPPQTLTNTTNLVQHAPYNVYATVNSCQSSLSVYTIIVNPVPHITNTDLVQMICSGSTSTPITLTSDVTGVTFTWSSTGNSALSGYQANGTGSTIPAQTINNLSSNSDTVYITVIPRIDTCEGVPQTFKIAVNPLPVTTLTPSLQTICTGSTSVPITASSNVAGTTFSWTAVSSFVNGGLVSGTGSIIPAQTLENASPTANMGTLTYTVEPTSDGCPGLNTNAVIQVISEPITDFATNADTGCSPFQVSFATNTLTFGNPDSLVFDWGDGTSTVLYPNAVQPVWSTISHTFTNSTTDLVTYTVTLTARNSCGDTSVSHTITVLPLTIDAFFSPSTTNGCEPLTVSFSDFSTGATYESWCFNYDRPNDTCLGTSTVVAPGTTVEHTFNAGTYTVALYITDGCSQDTAFQTIQVLPSPTVDFTHDNNVCANTAITFIPQATPATGTFLSAFDWQFGDGDSITGSTVTHAYDSSGVYDVCLRVTASNGCTRTLCRPVTVVPTPIADFSGYDTCVNTQPIQFTNHTEGASFYEWNFGDGNTSVLPNPTNNYLSAGTYTVTLIGLANGCSDTVSHAVTVYPKPTAAFTLVPEYLCGTPSTVGVTNSSTGALGYMWDFGNGTVSTAVSPTATYTDDGTFTVTLAVSNQFNCSDTTQDIISIYPNPEIQSIDIEPSSGCQPHTVTITANTVNGNRYVWDYGDGTPPVTSNSPSVMHTYSDTGTYTISVQAYSFLDCGDTVLLSDTVRVYITPVADFSYEVNLLLEPIDGTVIFTNASQHSETYVWDFGDGASSTEINPVYRYQDVNIFQVTLYAYNRYCADSIVKDVYVFKRSLFVPNAMQPDFSGNDLVRTWQPIGVGIDSNYYRAQVFNTWGELLWESTKIVDTKPSEGWDGTYKGVPCPQDVYVWKIYAKFLDNTVWDGMDYGKGKKTIGDITLIR